MSYAFVTYETLSHCDMINFHTTPTNWLTDWLNGGWLANWLTDFSAYQLTDQLTGWLVQLLTGWLTDSVADRLLDLLATIHVTNPWNKTHFSWIFWKILYIHSSHLCSHSNMPLSFPNVDPRIFWSTETTVIPKSTLGNGKITQVFQDIVTSIVAHWLIDLTGWLTYWDSY